ncbi:hypothetical protein FIV42_23710 [Persicimonas caeni]|uniref:Uncharacterized protein n=1 Tax=Persicimonas caeni TaxID=2292766 RepID=A0A4Y6PZ97_PERCE|nr:hypothetical protein [Persicimonas caeni]QDG53641.1 hypothetical protein FIV42_23710 [Persicimonas caeni]QED34862.1 hypothetical protein FRD00_23705 [Persicimonas caeni]
MVALLAALVLAASGCGDDGGGQDRDTGVTPSEDAGSDVGADAGDTSDSGDDADAGTVSYPLSECDPLVEQQCAMPWPSNLYMAPDDTRATGYTLTFGETSLPANRNGSHIDPEPYARMDGYGLGVPIMAVFPDVDVSGMAGRYSVEESVAADAPVVLLRVSEDGNHERVPYWAELDVHAESADDQTLFVRPAVILEENARYVVAFRDLKTTAGADIAPSEAFQKLLDGDTGDDAALAARQARFDEVFTILEEAGVQRDSLTLAWDFRTASSDAMHGRMLQMRDEALAAMPDGPEFTINEVREYVAQDDGSGKPVDDEIFLELEGTIEVPHYMRKLGNGYVFNLDDEGNLVQNGTRDADVLIRVPHSAVDEPAGLLTYGHGLLGSREEIYAGHLSQIANDYNYILVAVDLVGMSYRDQEAALTSVLDLSNFTKLADRLHQGMLEYILVTRAAGTRLPGLEEITSRNIQVYTDEQYYMGGSQGGIFGQTFMALTPDIERGYLAVPGNNYSTLLYRSTGFDPFHSNMKNTYGSALDRAVGIALMQLLWAGTEPVSYVRRIEDEPFDGTPTHVLMTVAKGDYQVAVVTNEHIARTDIGIPILENYDADRTPWNLNEVSYPHTGSGIILYDFGNPWPDDGNAISDDGVGDPHSKLSGVPAAGEQLNHFLRTGEIIDVCEGAPCQFDP